MPEIIPEPIDWDQLQSLKNKLKEVQKTAAKLTAAYYNSQVKVTNRINTISKLSNALLFQSSSINRQIDRHLSQLRKIRSGEISDRNRSAERKKQTGIRPKLDRTGKRAAKRVGE